MATEVATARQQRQAQALIFLVPAMWALNYVVARKATGVIAPHQLALGRWSLAGLILVLLTRRELWRERHAVLADWRQHLVLGCLGMLICGAWVYIAGHSTGAMNIALIYSAAPVLIMLAASVWLHERLTRLQIVGVLLALAGMLHVIVKGQWATLTQLQFSVGDLWIAVATLSWALYALLMRVWPSRLSAPARLAVTSVGGVVALLPFALWENFSPATPAWSTQGLLLIVVAALFPGVGAYWAYGRAQQVLGPSRVAVCLYLGPLFSALVAWGWLHEPFHLFHLIGAALILPGMLLATQRA